MQNLPNPENPPPSEEQHRSRVAVLVAESGKLLNGTLILKDWVGAGMAPVTDVQANQRSQVCELCPMNQRPDWTAIFKEATGASILAVASLKNKACLRVENEEKIGECRACLCYLPLKVWVPLEHILAHTTPETLRELDPRCWVLKEQTPCPPP